MIACDFPELAARLAASGISRLKTYWSSLFLCVKQRQAHMLYSRVLVRDCWSGLPVSTTKSRLERLVHMPRLKTWLSRLFDLVPVRPKPLCSNARMMGKDFTQSHCQTWRKVSIGLRCAESNAVLVAQQNVARAATAARQLHFVVRSVHLSRKVHQGTHQLKSYSSSWWLPAP
jgi:hypothetical protein